jgi:hypothetical protein
MSAEKSATERPVVGKPFPPGVSGNPGGKPKKLREIEAMLDQEHRTVANMREVFGRLKALALGEIIHVTDREGNVDVELKADSRFMGLYLDRVMGPVKDLEIDLSDAPSEALAYLREKLRQ